MVISFLSVSKYSKNDEKIEISLCYHISLEAPQGCTITPKNMGRKEERREIHLRDDSNITSHVRRLRKKIEDDPSRPEYIQTVRGVGYRMNMVKKE